MGSDEVIFSLQVNLMEGVQLMVDYDLSMMLNWQLALH